MGHLQKFNYRILKNSGKPKLVFLHGLMGYGQNWRSQAKKLADHYEILLYDQRGHGKSFQPDGAYSPKDYAEDLNKILEELDWDKIYLLGHSMGARNAIEFASQWPNKVEKLIIVDISPSMTKNSANSIGSIFEKAPAPFTSKEEAKKTLEERFDSEMANYLFSNLKEEPEGKWDWRFSKKGVLETLKKGREKSQWQQWQAISCPILVIRGEKSDYLSPEDFEKMLEKNKKAKGFVISEAGHWVHFEKPEEFHKAIKDFLESPK